MLGLIPGQPQPSQKLFDSRLWAALRALDPAREEFVEAESKRVGNVTVPEALILAMRASPCLTLEMSLADRVALLLQDYAFFAQDAAFFCDRLATLTALRGRETVERWQAQAQAGQMAEVVRDLLDNHYDPRYEESMARNFAAYPASARWTVAYQGPGSFDALARTLVGHTAAAAG